MLMPLLTNPHKIFHHKNLTSTSINVITYKPEQKHINMIKITLIKNQINIQIKLEIIQFLINLNIKNKKEETTN